MENRIRLLPYERKIEFYDQAMKLKREKGWGFRRIAKFLNLSKATVSGWIYCGKKPLMKHFRHSLIKSCKWCGKEFLAHQCRLDKNEAKFCGQTCFGAWIKHNDANPNLIKPILSPTAELSWFLGTMYSDGSLYWRKDGGADIELKVLDIDYLEKFNNCVTKILGGSKRYPIGRTKTPKGKPIFRCRFSNKLLGVFLRNRDHHKETINHFPCDFLQAFFSGDGGAYYDNGGGNLYVQCYNLDRNLLVYISHLLRELGIHSYVTTRKSGGVFRCIIRGAANIYKFRELIGFAIRRKQKRLKGSWLTEPT